MSTPASSPTSRRWRRPLFTLVVGALVAVGAAIPTSGAILTDAGTVTGSLTTDILDPPSGLSAAPSGSDVNLSWTASPHPDVSRYEVLRSTTSGSGYGPVGTPSGTSFTDAGLTSGTYYYVVRATYRNWTSTSSNEASATIGGPLTSGPHTCTSNAPDTGGDGNGYEVAPANACANDSVFAADMNSGTSTALSCGSIRKDRHRFWGFPFGLPGSVSSVTDITVRLDASLDALGGTNRLCVQLSWDGGTSWTAAQYATMSSAAETTYTLNGTWGWTWTAAQMSTSTFRVRVADASNITTRDYLLDYLAVTVTYVP